MTKVGTSFIAALALLSAFTVSAKETRLTDAAIAQILIEDSIASYSGNCPCPYNSARNGSRCGKRSAYNRAGGYAPLCFKGDVSRRWFRSIGSAPRGDVRVWDLAAVLQTAALGMAV